MLPISITLTQEKTPHPPISLSLSLSLPEKDPVTPTVPREWENRARTNLSDWPALVKAVVGSREWSWMLSRLFLKVTDFQLHYLVRKDLAVYTYNMQYISCIFNTMGPKLAIGSYTECNSVLPRMEPSAINAQRTACDFVFHMVHLLLLVVNGIWSRSCDFRWWKG